MIAGLVALDFVVMVVGLLIVLFAMGAGVWVWLRRKPMKKQEPPAAQ